MRHTRTIRHRAGGCNVRRSGPKPSRRATPAGTYDGVRPATSLRHLFDEIAGLTNPDVEFARLSPAALAEERVNFWGGSRSLPLWLPATHWGTVDRDPAFSLEAGLTLRPLADTVRAALADEQRLGPDRPRLAGLSRSEEAEILGKFC